MNVSDLKKALRLYVIPDVDVGAPLSLLEQAERAVEGGATAIQLRVKGVDGGALLETARAFRAATEGRALLIVNDRLDVAMLCGADGVHLGQGDIPVAEARRLAGHPFIIGASAHNPGEAVRAQEDGADYIGVGAVFSTGSKGNARVIGLDGLRETAAAAGLLIPVVAIGGVSAESLPSVVNAGAAGASVISAAVRGDVAENCRALRRTLDAMFTQ
ncbi:MAG: thiamine phosphate synthase [Synergistaceae bacterium]|nr:thiamine phosphate synthase [Synergistaceae bacterium]